MNCRERRNRRTYQLCRGTGKRERVVMFDKEGRKLKAEEREKNI
jgi:hypothetical protein